MLWSVVKNLGGGDSTQEVGKNTRLRLVFPRTLLSCYPRFLRALQQNRAQSRLLYLVITACKLNKDLRLGDTRETHVINIFVNFPRCAPSYSLHNPPEREK